MSALDVFIVHFMCRNCLCVVIAALRPVLREQYRASGRLPLGVFWQTMHLSALKDPH
jgi:hypothetical protein